MSARRSPSISRQATLASGTPTALDTNGTVRDARGLASITYSSSSPKTANWMLIRPTTPSRSAIRAVASSTCGEHLRAERHRRDHAGRVAGVHAGLLDVLHDRPDPHRLAVAERVHVHLDRVLEEAVQEDRAVAGVAVGAASGSRPAPRASNRSPSRGRRARSSGARAAGSRRRRRRSAPPPAWPPRPTGAPRRPSSSSSAPKLGRSSARWIESTGVPSSGTPASASPRASFSGVWPPNWTITPSGCSSSTTPSTSSSVSGSK